ncbi:MAG: phosphatase PAP2 family protein [bacterium]|nr:phosphatase PAP2 family protein [bacterium]
MIEWLESIDRSIVLSVNSWNTPFLDELFWLVSAKLTWIPFYLFLLFLFFRKSDWKNSGVFLLCAIIAVGLSDFTSSQIIKDSVMRYRPSHHALLTEQLHFYSFSDSEFYKGGQYGFVSSHAANFFAVCTFAWLALKNWYPKIGWLVFSIAVLVSFSRLYLGVHYLSDLIGGALLGTTFAWLIHRFLFLPINKKLSTEA